MSVILISVNLHLPVFAFSCVCVCVRGMSLFSVKSCSHLVGHILCHDMWVDVWIHVICVQCVRPSAHTQRLIGSHWYARVLGP